MVTKQQYVEYLISTPINHTCTNLAGHLEGVSHHALGLTEQRTEGIQILTQRRAGAYDRKGHGDSPLQQIFTNTGVRQNLPCDNSSKTAKIMSRSFSYANAKNSCYRWLSAAIILVLLFAAIFVLRGPGNTHLTSTPTATVTASPIATNTAIPSPTPTINISVIAKCFGEHADPKNLHLTQWGDLLIDTDGSVLDYPLAQLPDGTPLKPYQLKGSIISGGMDSNFPGSFTNTPVYQGNIYNIYLSVCNTSTTQSHSIQGLSAKITSFTSYTGQLNTWIPLPCDTSYFTTPSSVVGEGGCGGSVPYDTDLTSSFSDNAGIGTIVTATTADTGSSIPLPDSLKPGGLITLRYRLTLPQKQGALQAGTYSFAASVMSDGASSSYSDSTKVYLFAPIAHHWNGAACNTPAMLAQIPSTPGLNFICPAN